MTPLGGNKAMPFSTAKRIAKEIALYVPFAAPLMRSLFLPNPDDKLHHRAPPNTASRIDSLGGLHECAIGAR